VSFRISCRECWQDHDAHFDCWDIVRGLKATPEGAQELEQRRKAVYAAAAGAREANSYSEAWRWAQKAGAPHEALRKLREGPDECASLKAARTFNRDTEALFLLLLGPPGVGKTLAASLAVVDFASKWPWNEQPSGPGVEPIRYEAAANLTRLSAFDAEAKRYVESMRGCHLLVLEDCGDEGTELGKGLFVELLMARHASRRRTVITGNLQTAAFRARYGAAVADRIRACGYVPDLFGEKSRRTRGGRAA
jgi:DNA polymerase III delta prime subunit